MTRSCNLYLRSLNYIYDVNIQKGLRDEKSGCRTQYMADGKVYIHEEENGPSRRIGKISDLDYEHTDTVHKIHYEPQLLSVTNSM